MQCLQRAPAWTLLAGALLLAACAPAPVDEDAGGETGADAGPVDASPADQASPADHAADAGAEDSGPPVTGGIIGRICAPSGDFFIADSLVEVRWMVREEDFAVTRTRRGHGDPSGVFRLRDLPVGTFTFHASFHRLTTSFRATVLPYGADGTDSAGLTPVGDHCFAADALKLAVVQGSFDSIEDVIDALGFTDVTLVDDVAGWAAGFLTADNLASYDAVYLNCGINDDAVTYAGAGSLLKSYVASGGSLYASDWSYYFVESAYPNVVEFYGTDGEHGDALYGASELVHAEIQGSTVAKMCGRVADVDLNLPYWAVMESASSAAEVLVKGTVHAYADGSDWDPSMTFDDAPLMIRHTPDPERSGSVVYTSFHNEAQATDDMLCILKYVILSL